MISNIRKQLHSRLDIWCDLLEKEYNEDPSIQLIVYYLDKYDSNPYTEDGRRGSNIRCFIFDLCGISLQPSEPQYPAQILDAISTIRRFGLMVTSINERMGRVHLKLIGDNDCDYPIEQPFDAIIEHSKNNISYFRKYTK